MRAMSLVSSDAEGEQNEIRNLQEKLESTMRLVGNLSGQLTELKEQVMCQSTHECHFLGISPDLQLVVLQFILGFPQELYPSLPLTFTLPALLIIK